jgi:integrase
LISKNLLQQGRCFEKNSTKGCHSVIHLGNFLKTHSYLAQSRNGVYYARFIVPKSLRVSGDLRREIRISTATKDPRDAAARARALRVLLDQMFYSGALCSRDTLTSRLQALMTNFRRPPVGSSTFSTDIRDGRYVATDIKPGEGKEAAETVAMLNRDYLAQISTTPPSPSPSGMNAPVTAPAGTEIHHPAFLSNLSLTPLNKMVDMFMVTVQQRVKNKTLTRKAYNAQKSKLNLFIEYFENVAIGSLDAEQVQQYELDLESYPGRREVKSIQPAWTVRQLIAAVKAKTVKAKDGKPFECLDPLTVSGYMVVTRQFLKFAAKKFAVHPMAYEPRAGSASAPKTRGRARDPFDDADMKTIFESPYMVQAKYLHAYQYWIPLVSAFTGARIGEVSQLHVADVIEIDGIPMFDITDIQAGGDGDDDDSGDYDVADEMRSDEVAAKRLKNVGSRRKVPIHSKLLALGFLDYVSLRKRAGEVYVFELNRDGRDGAATRPSRWFNAELLRDTLGITSKRKVLHSFRHSFVSRLGEAIIEANGNGRRTGPVSALDYPEAAILRRLVGHSDAHAFTVDKGRPDAHEAYQHAPKAAVLQRVLERFTLDVNFSPFVMPPEKKEAPRKSTLTKVKTESIIKVKRSPKAAGKPVGKLGSEVASPSKAADMGEIDMAKLFG